MDRCGYQLGRATRFRHFHEHLVRSTGLRGATVGPNLPKAEPLPAKSRRGATGARARVVPGNAWHQDALCNSATLRTDAARGPRRHLSSTIPEYPASKEQVSRGCGRARCPRNTLQTQRGVAAMVDQEIDYIHGLQRWTEGLIRVAHDAGATGAITNEIANVLLPLPACVMSTR